MKSVHLMHEECSKTIGLAFLVWHVKSNVENNLTFYNVLRHGPAIHHSIIGNKRSAP